ncbi:hypothetical protein EKN09_03780 [Vibrio penaeicida]|uniref:hypothetical protein n=1 Tax=Vibrio penaeicida TaxID=104609 RepID=UPI000F848B13|nr:hypothetical protein [Vibrio penaeicida]RTZ24416.1 hypothetical protein EKN09_03780 [Vibrio penaeicida]
MQDSEPHMLFQFKEENAAEWQVLSKFFDDEMGLHMGSQGRVLTGFHTALPILDLEPLNLQIGVLSERQLILAEPSILRLLGYIRK